MPVTLAKGEEPVNGYRLVKPLGQGGFGQVWEAEAPGGLRVALKFIRTDTGHSDPELRAIKAIRDIRHPHLLEMHFCLSIEDYLVIATSLCDKSLLDRFREFTAQGEPGIPLDPLLRYMEETAVAIDFLNERGHTDESGRTVGIQHRDIKPHNIFLVGDSVKVADFGLAKALENSVTSHTGAMTPHYAPPEMFKDAVSKTSDQYSLAVSYVQLRTGKLPFTGSVHQIIYAHMHEPPKLDGLLPEEQPIVTRALSKEPTQRWASCGEFVAALKQACLLRTPVHSTPGPKFEQAAATLEPDEPLKSETYETKPVAHAYESTRRNAGRSSNLPLRIRSRRNAGVITAVLSLLSLTAAVVFYLTTNHATSQGKPQPIEKPGPSEVAKTSTGEPPSEVKPSPPSVPLPAVFNIAIDPDDASLEVVDGTGEITGAGSQRVLRVTDAEGSKTLKLVAKRDGYSSLERELRPTDGLTQNLFMTLEPLPAVYEVTVQPTAALLTVEGVLAQISGSGASRRITVASPDEATTAIITATHSGYEPAVQRVVPKRGTEEKLTLSLTPRPAVFDVAMTPMDALLRVEGVDANIDAQNGSPLIIFRQPDGASEAIVHATKQGYEPAAVKILPKPGGKETLTLSLIPKPAVLELTLEPKNATLATTPSDVKIRSNELLHILTVDRPDRVDGVTVTASLNGYNSDRVTWNPLPGGIERQSVKLIPKPAVLELTLEPAEAEIHVTPSTAKLTGSGPRREVTVDHPDQSDAVVLTASLSGYVSTNYSWSPKPGAMDQHTLRLERRPVGTRAGEQRELAPGITFCWCPPDSFKMGSPESDDGAGDDEKPQVDVRLTYGFWLGKTEVTQGQWQQVMNTEPWKGQDFVKEGTNFPATYVSWEDATEFCAKLTEQERRAGKLPQGWRFTLPTEAQWEYACRAGTTTRYSFGEDASKDASKLGEYAWWGGVFGGNAKQELYAHEVGQKRPNPWGLYDMHGNVWEWCADWYQYTLTGGTDPSGPSSAQQYRVRRGGCWGDSARSCRSANRSRDAPVNRVSDLGFRVALVQD